MAGGKGTRLVHLSVTKPLYLIIKSQLSIILLIDFLSIVSKNFMLLYSKSKF